MVLRRFRNNIAGVKIDLRLDRLSEYNFNARSVICDVRRETKRLLLKFQIDFIQSETRNFEAANQYAMLINIAFVTVKPRAVAGCRLFCSERSKSDVY